MPWQHHSGRSAVWLARTVWVREVGGSNPPAPTIDYTAKGFCEPWGPELVKFYEVDLKVLFRGFSKSRCFWNVDYLQL